MSFMKAEREKVASVIHFENSVKSYNLNWSFSFAKRE